MWIARLAVIGLSFFTAAGSAQAETGASPVARATPVLPLPDPAQAQALIRTFEGMHEQRQSFARAMQSQRESQLTVEQRRAMQDQVSKLKAGLQHLTPELRATMERQAAQWRTMAPPRL